MTEEPSPITPPYEVVAIRRADAPAGTEGGDWHRYEIAFEGSNNIKGFKPQDQ